MQTFENQTFRFKDWDSAATYSDLEFVNCEFFGCSISNTHSPLRRTTVRRMRFTNSSVDGCAVESAIVEDVVIDGLNTHGELLQTWAAVFKHVVLKGKIDRVMTSDLLFAGVGPVEEQIAFKAANAEYYRHVDWALDISQGEFKEIDIRGVPGRLIRRDPETQLHITRSAAMQGEWRELPFRCRYSAAIIQLYWNQNYDDMIFVAPKRDRDFRDYLFDVQLLRKAGIAEPD